VEIRKERSFFYLLFAMLFFLLASATIDEVGLRGEFQANNLLFAFTLLFAVFGMQSNRRLLLISLALVGAAIVTGILAANYGGEEWNYLSFVIFLAYLLLALFTAISQLVRSGAISMNQLVGTVCVYLLLGVIWSLLYAALFAYDHGAFSGVPADTSIVDSEVWLYYSFVTLTTLGYGDIVPLSSLAKTLAYLEAIIGQFYLAILVAGLVSSFLARRTTLDGDKS